MSYKVRCDGRTIETCETLEECERVIENDIQDMNVYEVEDENGNFCPVSIFSASISIDGPEEDL